MSVPVSSPPFFCKPAQLSPLFNMFTESSARVMVTFPWLLSAIFNAAVSLIYETSIFTPASVIFAETPSATSIRSVVGVFGSVFFIVIGVPVLIVSTPPAPSASLVYS